MRTLLMTATITIFCSVGALIDGFLFQYFKENISEEYFMVLVILATGILSFMLFSGFSLGLALCERLKLGVRM